MSPLFFLAFVTLIAVIAFAFWNFASTKRHQTTGGDAGGADPLAGTPTSRIRTGAEIRASLDAATRRNAGLPER